MPNLADIFLYGEMNDEIRQELLDAVNIGRHYH